jgi:hypothetical protein
MCLDELRAQLPPNVTTRKYGVDFKAQPLTVLKYAAQSASGWSAACGLTPQVLAESQLGSLGHHSDGRIICARFDGPTG